GMTMREHRAKAADVAAPNCPIEKDATLRVLRPTKFVEPDEIVFRQNTDRFSKMTGVPVRVDFVGFEDLRPQTAVTANTGAGPDVVVGWMDDPHLYSDKLLDVTELAEYLGKKYGGWKFLAQTFGRKWKTDKWIAITVGAAGGPCNYRISWVKQAGFDAIPDDLDQFLTLCRKLKEMGHPPGFALGNAVGDANGYANWLLWSHNAYLADESGAITINSPQTIEALKYGKAMQETFIPGTLSWQDPSNNKAFLAEQISLTANGVSIYFVAKSDPKTASIAADMDHAPLPKGLAKSTPESALVINAMAFKHTKYPNAAKEYIRFMMEAEQYEPWLNACLGYWSNPLRAYDDAAVWRGDPKVRVFRDVLDRQFWPACNGPINAASAAIAANYVTVHMFAAVASGQATPEEAAAEAERQARRYHKT
ncbi:MAG: extracellular solute-binding protein, partial [Acetobacteraceae bacterium]|nr:extracellular solute-binding protein [Acetobacteraceae bacterium]